jgi:ATP-dependent RNA helicase RhlE
LNFDEFELHQDVLNAVDSMNYSQATPIQEQAIPFILEGKDLLACAQTGTGKTAAYLIPILDKVAHQSNEHTGALILVPTRELAVQIDQQIQGLGYFVGATSIAVYGGNKGPEWDQQKKALTQGADIIIATPGRLIAHLQLGYVTFNDVKYLVLDEADRMLDMGFLGDILKIMSYPDVFCYNALENQRAGKADPATTRRNKAGCFPSRRPDRPTILPGLGLAEAAFIDTPAKSGTKYQHGAVYLA